MTLDDDTTALALDDHRARHFRAVNFEQRMEDLLRLRAQAPRDFAVLHPRLQDSVQIYDDLRAPYTAALAAREENLRTSWRRKGGTNETFDRAVAAGEIVIEIDGISAA